MLYAPSPSLCFFSFNLLYALCSFSFVMLFLLSYARSPLISFMLYAPSPSLCSFSFNLLHALCSFSFVMLFLLLYSSSSPLCSFFFPFFLTTWLSRVYYLYKAVLLIAMFTLYSSLIFTFHPQGKNWTLCFSSEIN